MALKQIKHWSWGLIRSMGVGLGESVTLVLGMGGANAVGIQMPTMTLKQFGLVICIAAARSLFMYLKANPIPDIDEETK